MGPIASARAFKLIAATIATPLLWGCAGLHLDQGPDQVIQRTEGEDDFAEKQQAGPVAARVLPYALLAEQSYDPRVYANHRAALRATACGPDDPKDCGARDDDQRAIRWLDEWRYVWSCNGPDECGVRLTGQGETCLGRTGGPDLGAQGRQMSGSRHTPFAELCSGDKGDWESNFHWILRDFPIYDQYEQVRDHIGDFIGHIERDPCYRAGLTQITAVGHSLGGGLAQLAAYSDRRIRRVYGFDPSMVTGFYSVNPPDRDRIVQGLRIERVYEFGEVLAYGRLLHAALYPLSPCNPRVVQHPVPGLSWRSNRAAQPDRS